MGKIQEVLFRLCIAAYAFTLQLLKFSHLWRKKQLPSIFDEHLHCASDVYSYHSRYAAEGNFYKLKQVLGPTLVRKQHQP